VKFGFSENKQEESLDELKNYLDARFVSASESAWRILGFPMSGQHPATQRLSIHLENQQSVIFKEKHVLYHDMPKHCSWQENKTWKKRK